MTDSPCQELKADCVYAYSKPKEFIRICRLLQRADCIIDVTQDDFPNEIGPVLHGGYGRLAFVNPDLPANDETTQAYRSVGFVNLKRHRLTEVGPTIKEKATLIVDVFYLFAAINDAERALPDSAIQNILNRLCDRVAKLGYSNIYVIDDCVLMNRPGFRIVREFHPGSHVIKTSIDTAAPDGLSKRPQSIQ